MRATARWTPVRVTWLVTCASGPPEYVPPSVVGVAVAAAMPLSPTAIAPEGPESVTAVAGVLPRWKGTTCADATGVDGPPAILIAAGTVHRRREELRLVRGGSSDDVRQRGPRLLVGGQLRVRRRSAG